MQDRNNPDNKPPEYRPLSVPADMIRPRKATSPSPQDRPQTQPNPLTDSSISRDWLQWGEGADSPNSGSPNTGGAPDRINGMPVWKLDGVGLNNRGLIMRTDAWVHFSDRGDAGWGLMAPAVQIQSWRNDFAKQGITITPWARLPYKPYGKNSMMIWFILTMVSFVFVLPFFVMVPLVIIIGRRNQYHCRHIRFAPGLNGVFAWTSLSDSHVLPRPVFWPLPMRLRRLVLLWF